VPMAAKRKVQPVVDCGVRKFRRLQKGLTQASQELGLQSSTALVQPPRALGRRYGKSTSLQVLGKTCGRVGSECRPEPLVGPLVAVEKVSYLPVERMFWRPPHDAIIVQRGIEPATGRCETVRKRGAETVRAKIEERRRRDDTHPFQRKGVDVVEVMLAKRDIGIRPGPPRRLLQKQGIIVKKKPTGGAGEMILKASKG
jgi:hypothetical protein